MSNALILNTDQALSSFDLTKEKIGELNQQANAIVIHDPTDRSAYDQAKKLRMVFVRARTGIEKIRKELNADAQRHIRAVNGRAKELTEALAPGEAHLRAQEKLVKDEEERRKREAEEKRQAEIRRRVAEMAKYGRQLQPSHLTMTPEEFDEALDDARAEFEAQEIQRKAEEDRKRREEEERQKQVAALEEQLRKKEEEALAQKAKAEEAQKRLQELEKEQEKEKVPEEPTPAAELDSAVAREQRKQEAIEACAVARKERQKKYAGDTLRLRLLVEAIDEIELPELEDEEAQAAMTEIIESCVESIGELMDKLNR